MVDLTVAPERPYVLVSAAMSLDGCLDDVSPRRLLLSDAADFDRVDALRAGCDAILVGATTLRRDDPRLMVRSAARQARRVDAGRPAQPTRVTVTARGDLNPAAAFFTAGEAVRLVYAATPAVPGLRHALANVATIEAIGDPGDLRAMLADLSGRGVRRLLVEGGSTLLTGLLMADLVDELVVMVAPFFVGAEDAPRLVGAGRFPHGPGAPMRLAGVDRGGDRVVLRYLLGADA